MSRRDDSDAKTLVRVRISDRAHKNVTGLALILGVLAGLFLLIGSCQVALCKMEDGDRPVADCLFPQKKGKKK